MAKDKATQDAVNKTGGWSETGDRVYYMLAAGPNKGKVRPAVVVRADPPDAVRTAAPQRRECDLIVSVLKEDGVEAEQLNVAQTAVGKHEEGTWRWPAPASSGY